MKLVKILCLLSPFIFFGCTADTVVKPKQDTVEKVKQKQSEVEPNIPSYDSPKVAINQSKYSPFFAYDSRESEGGSYIEPATGGSLILQNGCLLLLQGSELKVPVFPNEKSSWDAINKEMILNGTRIPLNKPFVAAGIEYKNPNLSEFKKVADPVCAENKKFELIFGGLMF